MQTIEVSGILNTAALHDYLIAEVASFHRVTAKDDGRFYADDDCGSILHYPDTGVTTVLFADDLDPATVQQAIQDYKAT